MASLASQLDGIFKPKSIAVVGASSRPGTVGNDLFRNLLFGGYQGCVYPINPKSEHILGVHCFQSLAEIPGDVDLAVLIVPAKAVLGVIEEAKAKKVKGLIIISAGFKETGKEGLELEKQVAAKVREAGIPLIGPNCLGVINASPEVRMNATFARKIPAYGKLAFLSQSGALCTSVLDYAEARQMGFSKFISFGNKADVKETDLLEYFADDPETSVIAMYLEDIGNGQKFIEVASKIFWEKKKPLLCLKSGRSAEGAKAVSSHTGSLAGSDQVYNAIFAQCGVQRVNTIAELFDYAALYTTQPLPKGNRLAIITNAGGPGIMATDAAVNAGLKLAELTKETEEALKPNLPAVASLHNPVDVIGDARSDRYEAATRVVLEDPNVDMGIVILTPQSMTDSDNIGAIIPKAVEGIGKPVVAAFMGVESVAVGVDTLVKNSVPNYSFPEDGIHSLGAANRLVQLQQLGDREYVRFNDCDVEKAKKIIADALGGGTEKYLTQAECRPLLECYKLPLLKSGIARSAEEAAEVVRGIGKKVVMKVMSADVVHKFDAGGVILNVDGADAAKAAYAGIYENVDKNVPGAKIDGILIEEMAAKGAEVIVGCNRDGNFGPLLMFGLGGTLVEVLKDVTFRLAPMWKTSAERMVREIKAFKVLDGFRGAPKADVASIVTTILRISEMVTNHPEIAEMDINPLIVHAQGEGSSVADSRVMLRKPE
ncbi:MAG: acetate--CoA ligase family protein [Planctomycetaceae bacterium]|nr:acetate--CoA ligase family protein [Planctomycetaceae bacterium]